MTIEGFSPQGKINLDTLTPGEVDFGRLDGQEVWREYEGKADSIFSAYTASDPKDDKLLAEHTRLQEEGDAAFRRCFAERATNEGFFAKLVEQAQALVDRLPSR